jgi:hypothetical protein
MQWWIVAIVMGNLAFSAFILWLIFNYKLKRDRSRAEDQERLLARFGTSQEMVEFLSSPAGERFFRAFAPRSNPPVKELGKTLQGGLITLFLGLAFLVLAWAGAVGGDAFYVPGTIMTMIGLGILVSAGISASLLKRSGLLPRNDDGRGTDPL